MKDQYFGDVNDYQKYSILRILTAPGNISLTINWMLTAPDQSRDGGRVNYLENPETWRHYDPELYDFLRLCVSRGQRKVSCLERSMLFPSLTSFFSQLLKDDLIKRESYFSSLFSIICPHGLLFFDPDNGIEVKSVREGRRGSSKYLYWKEIKQAYNTGSSVLIYQHIPRISRTRYRRALCASVRTNLQPADIFILQSMHTMFVLLPQKGVLTYYQHRASAVQRRWNGRIKVYHYH